eukprot:CAMPEP_0170385852 /NCGR_PEP_ID=MMETSP0117_2-20130122/16729_1 /TAXON_ID=400756 /ORGANISM="Durinskia baltica, Strain CSIRO CS-38" /LENGTH=293 /DNA_ID=CAMNT_0010641649 /DNA_START=123 /DNA_END=1004 /DNA_ORIENTATION=-
MGFSMAKNLTLAPSSLQRKVVVFDMDKSKSKALAEIGAIEAIDVKSLAKECDVIITMLPASKHVQGVMTGPDGIIANAKNGALLIDSSTIDPMVSRSLHEAATAANLRMVDAPVSGGVTGAAAGTLTFMVGGTPQNLEASKAVLSAMGKNIVHCGDAGAGGIAKLCNNLSLGISMIATAEAMNLGVQLGMDPVKLAGILNTSTGRCWSSEMYNPVPGVLPNVPASKNYAGGFGVGLIEKDLGLAVDLAQKMKCRVPLGSNAHQLYGMLADHGYAGKDFSVVYDFLKQSSNPKA